MSEPLPESDRLAAVRADDQLTDAYAPLVRSLESTVGDRLRSVGVYHGDDLAFVCMRPDVADAYSDRALDQVADDVGFRGTLDDDQQSALFELGDVDYVVTGFENGVVVRVRAGNARGVVVSLERPVDAALSEFVATVTENLPQRR